VGPSSQLQRRYLVQDASGKENPPLREFEVLALIRSEQIKPDTRVREAGKFAAGVAWDYPSLRPAFQELGHTTPPPGSVSYVAAPITAASAASSPVKTPAAPKATNTAAKSRRASKKPLPDLPPLLPADAPNTLVFSMREYARQFNAATWMIVAYGGFLAFGLVACLVLWPLGVITFLLGPSAHPILNFLNLAFFCVALFGLFQRPALRRKVAESGVDPDLWQQHVGRAFQRTGRPIFKAAAISLGIFATAGIFLCVAGAVFAKLAAPESKRTLADSTTATLREQQRLRNTEALRSFYPPGSHPLLPPKP